MKDQDLNTTVTPAVIDRPSSPERVPVRASQNQQREQQLEPLFPRAETEDFRLQWGEIQGNFVDEPKSAVEQADKLVGTVIQRLAAQFSNERKKLEQGWAQQGDVSTEDLRQALRRYHAFFDRLLSL